jgi:phenylacetate-coenzyme A ligase PaaK-like adenylate-forming protein
VSDQPENLVFAARARIAEVQEKNFAATMDLAFRGHPYYRRRFAELGLRRADFASLADLAKLPLTFKRDYMVEPDNFRLDVPDMEEEAMVVWDVMHTTGTSGGKPTPFISTSWDFYNTLTANRRALEIRGVRETDIVANLCPLTLYPAGAYNRTMNACSAMKIPVVSALPGRPSPRFQWSSGVDDVVTIVMRTRATILWGVASFIRRVILRAEEIGADFSAVRLLFLMGEGVTEAMRADMVTRLRGIGARDPWVSVSYAATEMQVGNVECASGSGYHNPAPDEFYFEVVDPETHVAVPDGQHGLVVMTHLNRRGTVLLRYALGDTSVKTTERCPHCGATTDRFVELPHRVDGLFKVRGMLINPPVIYDALGRDAAIAEFQVVVDRENPADPLSMDTLTIRVAPAHADPALPARAAELVKNAIGVRPLIEIVAKDAIYDANKSEKAKRLIDLRRP